MPESLKVLRRRVRTVRNTKQITRAMEMVSASKLRRAQASLFVARPYIRNMEILLARLAPEADAAGHPLFVQRRVKRSTLVVFTADRGLCGSYNATIIRIAESHLRDLPRGRMDLICVGRRGHQYFSKRAWPIVGRFTDMGGVLNLEQSRSLSDYLRDRFLYGETDEIYLLYTSFVSTSVHKVVFEKFLDLDESALAAKVPADDRAPIEYIFEPSRERVFEKLVPAYLEAKVFITLAESFTSEHASRMLAMNSASNNCDEMRDTLTLRLNKARQGTITGDLLDIVGGAEALQKG